MSQRNRAITHFADAVNAATGLEALFGRVVAAAVLHDDDGTVLDMRPFIGDDACAMCAIEWALGVTDDWHSAHRVVLLSGGAGSVHNLREDDIRLYQTMREGLDAQGIELVDWIQTDGDEVRSLTFTCDVTPNWDDQAAAS